MMARDPPFRKYVVEKYYTDNVNDPLAQIAYNFYARRWVDFLELITDNSKGIDGASFLHRWKENRKIEDWDMPHWFKGCIESYSELALTKLPTFHRGGIFHLHQTAQ